MVLSCLQRENVRDNNYRNAPADCGVEPVEPMDNRQAVRSNAFGARSLILDDSARKEEAPLSIGQARQVLFEEHYRLARKPKLSFNLVSWWRMQGSLNTAAFERAANRLVARHDALRAVLQPAPGASDDARREGAERLGRTGVVSDGLYLQSVRSSANLELRKRDIGRFPEGRRDALLRDLIDDEYATPFNYAVAPLMRLQLVRVSSEEHVALMAWPHFSADAVSKQVCQRDLLALYEAEDIGDTVSALKTVAQYPTFVRSFMERLQTGKLAAAASYWLRQWEAFRDAVVSPEELPGAFPTASPLGCRIQSLTVSPGTTQRLRELARARRVTPFIICLSAYAALLNGLTGRTRVGIWVPFANRLQPGAESAVGWFAHSHMIGLDLETSSSWGDLISHCRVQMANALLHHELPLGAIRSTLGQVVDEQDPLGRLPRSHPLLMFDWQVTRAQKQPRGLTIGPVPGLNVTSFPFSREFNMRVLDAPESMTITLMFGPGMFRQSDARLILERYRSVLEAIGDGAQSSIPRPWLASLRVAR